jgi:Restriction endonuclease
MPVLDLKDLRDLFQEVRRASSPDEKGKALERLVAEIFEQVPGLTLRGSDVKDQWESQEIDLAFRVLAREGGLPEATPFLLVECKNWESTVGSSHVATFEGELTNAGLRLGVLVAANGISGNPDERRKCISDAYEGRSKGHPDRGPHP